MIGLTLCDNYVAIEVSCPTRFGVYLLSLQPYAIPYVPNYLGNHS